VPQYLRAVPQDPFSGNPLIYTTTASEYRLYSVDYDRKDDGGVVYGLGSKAERMPRQGQPRDLGVRVDVSAQRRAGGERSATTATKHITTTTKPFMFLRRVTSA
jgi:hypothetical protein